MKVRELWSSVSPSGRIAGLFLGLAVTTVGAQSPTPAPAPVAATLAPPASTAPAAAEAVAGTTTAPAAPAATAAAPTTTAPAAATATAPATAAPVAAAAGTPGTASAAPADTSRTVTHLDTASGPFPRPAVLKSAVAFWTDVFSKWSENQVVVHDMDDLGKVYYVLDYTQQALTMDPSSLARLRASEERETRAKLDAMFKRIDSLQNSPEQLTADEHRIWAMFDGDRDPARFRKAAQNVRLQRGLRERTELGLRTAQRYLPQMERTFASYGLPTGLTRLPIVESSFNIEAYSKDAAAGIWQFIPSSARIYMRLNNVVDDRRDPWIATDAAARHLKDDYELLQDWPLAVTAYNHGRAGIKRALQTVNGTGLSDLIERFDGPRFGFASRNFYAEFLAATDTERAWRARNATLAANISPLRFDTVVTRDYVSYETLRRLSGLDDESFRMLNPGFRPEVMSGRLFVPPGHEIRVPNGQGRAFDIAYAALSPGERSASQRQLYAAHTVRRGETLARIAKRYGVSSSSLLAANNIDSATDVRPGMKLSVPQREPTTVVASTSRSLVAKAEPVSTKASRKVEHLRTHTVKSGQTLSDIAKRYQVSVKELREVNALGSKDRLRVGSTLKIPAA